jgi:hypothetical protein
MGKDEWCIFLQRIPYSESGKFWVGFESNPGLKKTKENIYGRCLPCIQSLYHQLKEGRCEITLGNAYNCWKITAIVESLEECLSLLHEFERRFPFGHVYGKLGSGRINSETMVVVFHAENAAEMSQIRGRLEMCFSGLGGKKPVWISRACSVLYDDILGDWQDWLPVTKIKHPENVDGLMERLKKILYGAVM